MAVVVDADDLALQNVLQLLQVDDKPETASTLPATVTSRV
jgi:hypothetical protein